MKKFFSLAVLAIIAICMSSCAKDNAIDADLFSTNPAEEQVKIFAIDLAFDAPADMQDAVIEFYDETGQGVATMSVPVSDIQNVSFVSETKPTALYTKGLQNVNADGVLPLPDTSVQTKAGNAVLLVIR